MSTPPRVCFLTGSDTDWGGASRVLYTMLRSLDLTRVEPLVLLSGPGPIRTELEERGIRCQAWGQLTEPVNKLHYIKILISALSLFRRERIKALHINHRFWRPAEVLAAMLLRIPVLVHFHVVNRQLGSFMDRCSVALCVSRFVAGESLPASLPKEILYNPVDLDRFNAGECQRSVLGIPKDAVAVAFLGQIRDIKGIQDFIAMAHRVTDPRAIFLIAGECRDADQFPGSYSQQDLRSMAKEDPRILYLGYRKDVENIYHSADIVVVPSRWEEPLGLICLESGACRKAIIATNVGGIPEVIKDGVNGYLVNSGDINKMAIRVSELISDPDIRLRMGEAGRARVERDFTCDPIRQFESLLLRYARS